MKIKFDIKNKKGDIEANVEKLVEKGMDQHDKNWKDKFDTKNKAKIEMLEIKHKQRMETMEKNATKKSWIQKIEEEKRKTRELELEAERKKEQEKKKVVKIKIIVTVILAVIGLAIMVLGVSLGTMSGDSDSGWYGLMAIGLLMIISIAFIWIDFSSNKK